MERLRRIASRRDEPASLVQIAKWLGASSVRRLSAQLLPIGRERRAIEEIPHSLDSSKRVWVAGFGLRTARLGKGARSQESAAAWPMPAQLPGEQREQAIHVALPLHVVLGA